MRGRSCSNSTCNELELTELFCSSVYAMIIHHLIFVPHIVKLQLALELAQLALELQLALQLALLLTVKLMKLNLTLNIKLAMQLSSVAQRLRTTDEEENSENLETDVFGHGE